MVPKVKYISVSELGLISVISKLIIMQFLVNEHKGFMNNVSQPKKVRHECKLDNELQEKALLLHKPHSKFMRNSPKLFLCDHLKENIY